MCPCLEPTVSICIRGWGDDRCQNIFGNGSKQPRGRNVCQVAPPSFRVINFFKSPSIKITFQRIWDPCGSHMGLLPGLLFSQSRSNYFIVGAVVSMRSVRITYRAREARSLGGWVQGGGGFPRPARSAEALKFRKLEKEDDSLYRSRLLILV